MISLLVPLASNDLLYRAQVVAPTIQPWAEARDPRIRISIARSISSRALVAT